MKSQKHVLAFTVICGLCLLAGCNGGGSSTSAPNRGFDLLPNRIEVSQTTGSAISRPTMMRVESTFLEPQGTIRGTIGYFPPTDIGPAAQNFLGAKVPAKWRFTYIEINQFGQVPCQNGIQTVERNVGVGEMEKLDCEARVFPLTVQPSVIDAQAPSPILVIRGSRASDTYGPPQVAILDEYGNVRNVLSATVFPAGPGTKAKIEVTLPNLSQYPSGIYQMTVSDIRQNGIWDTLGAAEITVYGNEPPPPPPIYPDPCAVPAPCLY